MIKFTKEEISLCKQVAERYRKKVEEGDWVAVGFQGDYSTIELVIGSTPPRADKKDNRELFRAGNCIPLWTISDCFEFFFQKGWQLEEFFKNGAGTFSFHVNKGEEDYHFEIGKTPLEACLKAVLAVLEEGK